MNFSLKNLLVPAIVLFIGLFLGAKLNSLFSQSIPNIAQGRGNAVRQSGFTFTNPLLECEVTQATEFRELFPFRDKVSSVVDQKINAEEASHISIYFRDLNNGPWLGINEKEEFSPSSLLKIPLMISYYQEVEKNPELATKSFVFDGSFDNNEQQNIKPEDSIEVGKAYTGEELIEKMIRFSDNNAAKLLSLSVTPEYFFKPYGDLSLTKPTLAQGEYYIRVKDYASFLRVLYNSSYLNQANSEKALEHLSKTTFTKGLRAGVPESIAVSHKFGERVWETTNEHQMHDCGIVYFPDHPYLLCIMTKGESFDSLANVISELSKLVYDEVETQFGK